MRSRTVFWSPCVFVVTGIALDTELRLRSPRCGIFNRPFSLFASLDDQAEAETPQEGTSHQEGLGGDLISDNTSITPVPSSPPKRRYSVGTGKQPTPTEHLPCARYPAGSGRITPVPVYKELKVWGRKTACCVPFTFSMAVLARALALPASSFKSSCPSLFRNDNSSRRQNQELSLTCSVSHRDARCLSFVFVPNEKVVLFLPNKKSEQTDLLHAICSFS